MLEQVRIRGNACQLWRLVDNGFQNVYVIAFPASHVCFRSVYSATQSIFRTLYSFYFDALECAPIVRHVSASSSKGHVVRTEPECPDRVVRRSLLSMVKLVYSWSKVVPDEIHRISLLVPACEASAMQSRLSCGHGMDSFRSMPWGVPRQCGTSLAHLDVRGDVVHDARVPR